MKQEGDKRQRGKLQSETLAVRSLQTRHPQPDHPIQAITMSANTDHHDGVHLFKNMFAEPPSASPVLHVPFFTALAATSATVMTDQTFTTLLSGRFATSLREDASAGVFIYNLQRVAIDRSAILLLVGADHLFINKKHFSPDPTRACWFQRLKESSRRGCCTFVSIQVKLDNPHPLSVLTGVHRHMLVGASTASAMNLNVPVSVRQPFDKAISELDEAANISQEVAETGNKTGIHNARLYISRAYSTLKAMCDTETARIDAANAANDVEHSSEDEDVREDDK